MNEKTLDPSEVSARLNVGAAAEEAAVREEDRVRSGRACTLFAVVEPDGRLARGCGAVSSQKVDIEVGAYEVIFDRNVRDCAYVATIGISGHLERLRLRGALTMSTEYFSRRAIAQVCWPIVDST